MKILRLSALVGTALVVAGCGQRPVKPPTPAQASGLRAQAGTSILNQDALLAGIGGKQWYKDNIPFIEVPDANIQKVYYYRWNVLKRNLKYTRPETGYVVTEFVTPVSYSGLYGGISDNPWHNNLDLRWARDRQYLDDDLAYWLRGAGVPKNQGYSTTMADAAYQRALVTGDTALLTNYLPDFVNYERKWESRLYDAKAGLFWQVPLRDGMEFTIGSYQTTDHFGGGSGYRATINGYEYADDRAIATIARLAGNSATASEFDAKANALKANVQGKLWDPSRQFFFHMMRDNAAQEYGQHPDGGPRNTNLPILPEGTLLDGRELSGYVPWMFNLPDDTAAYAEAWRQLMDPQGFNTAYGPATAEVRHRLFFKEARDGCCRWDGPHWPFATSQTLIALANLLNNYRNNNAVTKADYYTVLKRYTDLQFKNGRPYVAEAADSLTGNWFYDAPNHSEHYNHSAYVDLIIGGLLGVRPKADSTVDINPLIPSNWDYFALENVAYHGHNLSVLWDRTGGKYGKGAGLRVFVDGVQAASASSLQRLTVNVGPTTVPAYTREVNLATNPFSTPDQPLYAYPKASASFTSAFDSPLRAIDGSTWYDPADYGPNSRWTNYGSPNASDWLEVDFGSPTRVSQVKIAFYDDTGFGSIRAPQSYQVQWLDNTTWRDVTGQQRTPANPTGNEVNTVSFTPVSTYRVRVVATKQSGSAVGITEVGAYSDSGLPPLPSGPVQLVNKASGKCVDVAGGNTANDVAVTLWDCLNVANQRFTLVPTDSGYYRITAQHSGKVIDVAAGSPDNGAKLIQWDYLGGQNQQWRPVAQGGYYKFVARHSGRVLDVPNCGSTNGTQLWQYDDFGNDCQKFTLR